jgi:[glutamine synthetase] adenylyltransferase / [glutamine synthetase]-adenylyl-L-tyrosine phosphorylase
MGTIAMNGAPLFQRIVTCPITGPGAAAAAARLTDLRAGIADPAVLDEPPVRNLLLGILEGSPYVGQLLLRDPQRAAKLLTDMPESLFEHWRAQLTDDAAAAKTVSELMATLRIFKTNVALLTAVADLGGVWPVLTVTNVLSRAADACLQTTVRFLFAQATARGDWLPEAGDAAPEASSGYIVLAMGKYGAFELNYSSDIDLIVFYDLARLRLKPGVEPQLFFIRMTRDLVKIMQERTGDSYVFRTDLRLRPDPGATQIALSTTAAMHYYESFGQNWERAAMIKARPVAGDIDAGHALLRDLAPYVWRKYLDYAAIADIHAMKRQIHAFRGFGEIAVAGHNIKVGRGGIREIEFFAQTQQLIAGGRQADMRTPATLDALDQLTKRGWIAPGIRDELAEAYQFLRRLEHRLQMVNDEQTHELPSDDAALASLARFAGFDGTQAMATELVARLGTVQRHYAALFEDSPNLTRDGVNMVFAGARDDPATLAALAQMGYSQPAQVIATVRGWHHGRYRAVSSPRARERLTVVQPLLIEALAQTANPDAALGSFDRFLAELPAGVQLFGLLRANPQLMQLVAAIMGSAPRLANILSRRRRLLDAVLDPKVVGALPSRLEIQALVAAELGGAADFQEKLDRAPALVAAELGGAADFQEKLDRARILGAEQSFIIGVRVLSGGIRAAEAGGAYSMLAEELIGGLQRAVEEDFVATHGRVAGGGAAIVAMGKLGGAEMTAASDLDLIVVYDYAADASQSDGRRPLPVSQYYARLTQRLISALSAPTAEGRLYDVDMRLRPSGQKGPVATQLSSFINYQAREAWTWEHLALTRARLITGPPALRAKVEAAIRTTLLRPRDRATIAADVRKMRDLIAAEKGTADIWDLKQVRGGLVDLEFIAQYLQLVHAAAHPQVLSPATALVFERLAAAGILAPADADLLRPAARLLGDLTQILRLCFEGPFDPATAPEGLKRLLARVADAPDFRSLEDQLRRLLAEVTARFDSLVA